jgi:hypothetical protein
VSATRSLFGRAGAVEVAAGFVLFATTLILSPAATVVAAERVLFPAPLHITRELSDPVSQKTSTIDEYCLGNRMVSVSGSRTAIADYAKAELTEIDFAAGTYSVTKFEQIARTEEKTAPSAARVSALSAGAAREEWHFEPRGGSVIASRPAETTEAERKDENTHQTIRISADRQMTLGRGAIEAILGIGYPHRADSTGDVMLGALRSHEKRVETNGAASASASEEFHLPLEQVFRFEAGGEAMETRNVVVQLGTELVPPEALTIPSGAKLVESKAVAMQRLLEELDGHVRPSGN